MSSSSPTLSMHPSPRILHFSQKHLRQFGYYATISFGDKQMSASEKRIKITVFLKRTKQKST